jgi:hypothetical protein
MVEITEACMSIVGAQSELPIQLERKKPDLLSIALENNAAIDVIERLAALRREEMAAQSLLEFNEALSRVQTQIKRIAPDMENPQKKNKYASYPAIDREIRPIYSQEGFNLSFTHADCPKPDHVRVVARLALRSHIETYQIDMPVETTGAKGGDVMTKTHATASADSYAKRYLVKDIFNIAIGEDDVDGNITNGWLGERLEWIENCTTIPELNNIFTAAYNEAKANKADKARLILIDARDKRKKELQ